MEGKRGERKTQNRSVREERQVIDDRMQWQLKQGRNIIQWAEGLKGAQDITMVSEIKQKSESSLKTVNKCRNWETGKKIKVREKVQQII